MIAVTLPDGSVREYQAPVTVADVAQSIGAGLARAALAGKVNDKLVDLSCVIDADAQVAIITAKSPEALEIIRHSTSHLMAQAVKELFPQAEVTIGPAIENGFYYDFKFDRPFTPEDLEKIEARMHELVKKGHPDSSATPPRDEAIAYFKGLRRALQGRDHRRHSRRRNALLVPSGRLHRSVPRPPRAEHGQAQGLQAHEGCRRLLARRQQKRDACSASTAPPGVRRPIRISTCTCSKRPNGAIIAASARSSISSICRTRPPAWSSGTPRAWALWQVVEQYMRRIYRDNGYMEVKAPQLLDRSLWERSGHWAKYRSNMFTTESENRYYALQADELPGPHPDLQLRRCAATAICRSRFGEFGQCHRNEPSGSLHGLMRVRGFTQDDGHIFCTEDQILAECTAFTKLVQGGLP